MSATAPSPTLHNAAAQRLAVYVPSFLVIALYAFSTTLQAEHAGPWLVAGLGLALTLVGWLSGTRIARALEAGTVLVLVVALLPLATQILTGDDKIATTVARTLLWPQPLLALLASRILAIANDNRLARFVEAPSASASSVSAQSVGSGVALGLFLTLVFFLAIDGLQLGGPGGAGQGPAGRMILSALHGATIIHGLIDLLFFIILAMIGEGFSRLAGDRQIVARLTTGAGPLTREIVLARSLGGSRHRRGVRVVIDAIDTVSGASLAGSAIGQARDLLETANRRFLRALLPFLPLLGFLGTVIGLATAIADLPAGMGTGGMPDISGSLAGLAIKFETTLLGLLASMIASLALSWLERREAELAAATLLLVAARMDAAP